MTSLASTVRGWLVDGGRSAAYTALIAAGPVLLAVIAVVGRTAATTALAAGYLLATLGAVCWRAVLGP